MLKRYGHVNKRRNGGGGSAKKNVRCTSTRKEMERRTANRWKSCKKIMESVGLKDEDVLDRTKWKNDIQ